MMNVIVLAAGYGTRLHRDVVNNQEYQHLLNVSKSLLPVANKPLLTYWLDRFNKVDNIEGIFIGTNAAFHDQLVSWAAENKDTSGKRLEIINDGTSSNATRKGAVACISHVAQKHKLQQADVLICAGDTLFYEDFDLQAMVDDFYVRKSKDPTSCLLTSYTCSDKDVSKHGILEVDNVSGRVTSLVEKPDPTETSSRKACPCFYILSSAALQLVDTFLEEMKDEPIEKRDATGNFIKYLVKKLPVYTYELSGRFDVGGLQSYIQCNQYFLNKSS